MQQFCLITTTKQYYQQLTAFLNELSTYVSPLFLRLILAWEFGKAGLEKFHGSNWFADITFPFPFNLLSSDITWAMATYFEIFGAIALILGLATRFFSIALFILTIVAIATVHWPAEWHTLSELATGFRIIDEDGDGFGNYELPLLFMVMLVPLILGGAGKLSADYIISRKL